MRRSDRFLARSECSVHRGSLSAARMRATASMRFYEIGLETQHAKAHPREFAIASRVGGPPGGMIAAADFHNEPNARSHEIGDEISNRHLAAEPHSELA